MRTICAVVAVVLLAGCVPQLSPQASIVEACADQVDGYTGVATDTGVFVEGAGDQASQDERDAAGNSAACTLAGAEAPDEVWEEMVAAGRSGSGDGTDEWDGGRAVWSFTSEHGLDVSVTLR